jgi:hypothetical protein
MLTMSGINRNKGITLETPGINIHQAGKDISNQDLGSEEKFNTKDLTSDFFSQIIFLFSPLVVLEFELRALHFPGKFTVT